MVNVNKINLFPTTIYSFKSEITDEQNEEMLNYIYDKFENKYIDVKTNEGLPFGLEQGEDKLHMEPCFTPLVEFARAISANIFVQEGYLSQEVEITQMWANKQEDDSIHPPHTHANSLHSGIYYLKASDKTSGTQFFEPRPQVKVFVPRREKYLIQNSHMYQIPSAVGHGVIFPSWLQHWVPPTSSERTSISWNCILRGNYGSREEYQYAYF